MTTLTSDGSPTPAEDVIDEDDADSEQSNHHSDSDQSFHAPTEIDPECVRVDASTPSTTSSTSNTLDSDTIHRKTPEGYSSKKKVTACS